jgi:RNA-binding protein 5/10
LSGSTAHGVVVTQGNMSSFSGFATTGDSDASPDDTASQFLLFRGLEPGVTEELLAKGVYKLYKTKSTTPTDSQPAKKPKISSTSNDASLGAREGSLQRVLLVRDRKTNDSWRYGFAEFGSVEDAQNALAKYKATEKFTISSKPVLVTYIHAGVFVPVLQLLDEESARFTFSPLSNSATKLMYWDEAAYVNEFSTVLPEPPAKRKESERDKLAAAAAKEGLVTEKDGESRSKKRKIEKESATSSKKVVAPHLQFWTNRHAELHGLPAKEFDENAPDSDSSSPKNNSAAEPSSDSPPSQSFADLERNCCLLCSRQFKTAAEVNKHERISQLHRDNMKNEDLVNKALAKLKKTSSTDPSSAAYRDRAKERRQAFNQPKQPAAQHNKPKDPSKSRNEKEEEEETQAPVQSKGAALLGKMGWNVGEGLGAQGMGRTEAIQTELYTQGVGLGAEGGKVGDAVKEAERETKGGYKEFVGRTREKAKERYESLG